MITSDVRIAHKLLDRVSQGRAVLEEEISLIRSFLPEPPAQKALAEIIAHVDDAWSVASGNDWGGNSYDTEISIEDWLTELCEQLKGLIDTPAASPALPTGMRLADHAEYGRVVTSPKPDQDGVYVLLMSKPKVITEADWEYAHECELTFIDTEPAHPEFLETYEYSIQLKDHTGEWETVTNSETHLEEWWEDLKYAEWAMAEEQEHGYSCRLVRRRVSPPEVING